MFGNLKNTSFGIENRANSISNFFQTIVAQDVLKSDQLGSLFTNFYQILTNKGISLVNHGKVFKACVRTAVLYGSETWSLSTEEFSRIKRSDHAMICWLSYVEIEQEHSTEDLRKRTHVHHTKDVLRWHRPRLSGHLYRQEEILWAKIMNFNVDGPTSQGRPKLGWKDVVNADLCKKHLNISLASESSKWRNAMRPVTQQIAPQPTMTGTRIKNN